VGARGAGARRGRGKLIFPTSGHVVPLVSRAGPDLPRRPRVVTMLNEDFVPIRVDTDKRRTSTTGTTRAGGPPPGAPAGRPAPDGRDVPSPDALAGLLGSAGTSTGGTVNDRRLPAERGGPRRRGAWSGPRLRKRRGRQTFPSSSTPFSRSTIRSTRDSSGSRSSPSRDSRLPPGRVIAEGIASGETLVAVLRRMAGSDCSTGWKADSSGTPPAGTGRPSL